MKDAETARLANESNSATGSIFSKLSALRRDSMGAGAAAASVSTHDGGSSGSDSSANATGESNGAAASSSGGTPGGGLIGMFRKNSIA